MNILNSKEEKKFKLLVIILGIGLVSLYGSQIHSLHTVWELGDEAGYLWNAAYFVGTDWSSFASVYAYYGYGYSVILTPLFWITKNGVQIIRGAYIINIICVLGMYFIIIKLLKNIGNRLYNIIPFIAFLTCIIPYVASNTLKVLCETFLTFWYSLLVLLLYLYLKKGKTIYAVLLGISGAFIFFIHTRAIVVTGMLGMTLFLTAVKKRGLYLKNFLIFLSVAVIAFLLLYGIKVDITNFKYGIKGTEEVATAQNGNMVTTNYIFERLRWLWNDPINVIAVFFAKIFYSVIATSLFLIPGFICMGKQLWIKILKEKYVDKEQEEFAGLIVKSFIMVTFVLMVTACAVNGTGNDIRYAFYGRYYEFTIPVLFSFCMYFFFDEKDHISKKEMFLCVLFVILIGVGVWQWFISYLSYQSISVDTMRISAITKAVTVSEDIDGVMGYLIMTSVAMFIIYIFIAKKKYGKGIIICFTCVYLWSNTSLCIERIQTVHKESLGDTELAEYILENMDTQKIYMLDDRSYKYPYFYSRMQVLLKDKRLYVITPSDYEQIEDGSYIVAYVNTELKNTILLKADFLKSGSVFVLYQK
ncbi:MAG: hypothetical protein HDQ99_12160 [Lachnospiraceae bacterium]|nr:hypothetical protein [Lachnospiraceae bacterium]